MSLQLRFVRTDDTAEVKHEKIKRAKNGSPGRGKGNRDDSSERKIKGLTTEHIYTSHDIIGCRDPLFMPRARAFNHVKDFLHRIQFVH